MITVLTSPYPEVAPGKKQRFSCKWNCYYCPNEPGRVDDDDDDDNDHDDDDDIMR